MEYGNRSARSTPKSTPSQERKSSNDGLHIMGSLRDEQEEKQKLEKNNFDLKMKVYYLEESLKRFQDGEHMTDAQSDHQKIEISKLKLQLEDKQIDLEQRNLLLIKSKNAIEALKTEIERLRNENDHHQDLEDRIRRLKQLNDELEQDYRTQISQLEQQLSTARQQIDSREIEKSSAEDKVNHLEISCEQIDNHLKDTQQEKRRLQDQLLAAQQKIQALEEDATQLKAHMDLYRIELEELGQDRDAVKEKLRQEQLSKLKADEDAKVRLSDCTKHYESQIRTMRINHEQDMEKIRAGHMDMLADVRQSYQTEMARVKSEVERSVAEVRGADAQDMHRVKENFTIRIEEKNEEIKSLRSMMNADSQRVDTLLQELDATRQQLREKSQLSERLLIESTAKTEEAKVVPRIMKDLEECRANLASLQAQIQHEQRDKAALASQNEQLIATVDTLRGDLRQCEQALQSSQSDNTRMLRDISELTTKADGVEHVSRDNERLKGHVARLETDVLGLNHKVSELKRDLEIAGGETGKVTGERESVKNLLRSTQSKLDQAVDQIEALQIQTQSERERRSAAEAALGETRAVLAQSRDEIQHERAAKLDAERRSQQLEEETREMRKGLGHACIMSYNAMQEWDESLTAVLDGEMFGAYVRGGSKPATHSHSQSRQSALYSSPSRGGVSSSLLLNEDRSHDLMSVSTDVLLQRIAVSVERVGLKLQRAGKIRSLFIAQAEKLVDTFQQGMQSSQERSALHQHKLAEAQAQIQKLKNVIQRDRKQRDEETNELMQFKEVVLSQHTAQIRDNELRFAQVSQHLEHEKSRSDELQRQVASQSEELRSLQQINQRMHEDLEVLERTERVVVDLSNRAGELGELNRSMAKENEAKSESIFHLTKENNELKLELSSMVARAESLLQQVHSREEAIEESEAKLQGLVREIERLRNRQIHPELAKTILDTQSILQSAVRGSNALPTATTTRSSFSSAAGNSADKVSDYLNHVAELEAAAEELTRRTAEMLSNFESQMISSRSTMTRGAAAMNALKQEVYDLLDANSNLAVQMQQLVGDFKKSIRQLSLNATPAPVAAPEAPRSFAETRSASNARSESADFFPARRGLMSATVENGAGINLDDLRIDSHSPSSRSPPAKHYDSFVEPQYSSTIRSSAVNLSSTQRLGAQSQYQGPQSPEAFSSTAKSARFHSTPNQPSAATYKGTEDRHQTEPREAPSRGYQPSSYAASIAAYTPNTASRMSTNRLNKLGSDLEALARKLDSYDTSRSK